MTSERPDAAATAELLFKVMKRSRRLFDDRLSAYGLSLPRVKMLGQLKKDGPCSQAQLAGCFDLAPRTVTELVDGLERQGLVERRSDPADRRVKRVVLTEAGRNAHTEAWAVRTEVFDQIFAGIDDGELHALHTVLLRLDRQLDAEPVILTTTD